MPKSTALIGRSLINLIDLTNEEIEHLLDLAIQLKSERARGIFRKRLDGLNFALIFLKPSCRTRLAFVTAAVDEGAHIEIFPSEDIRFGIKESIKDIARVFGRMFHGIAFRGFDQSDVEMMVRYAGIPVWNGLSDKYHPTQVLADLMTLREEFGSLSKVKLAFVGDGRNNMVNSLSVAALKFGFEFRVVSPKSLHPTPETLQGIAKECGCRTFDNIKLFEDIQQGVAGCDAIYGDIWISMGEEALARERIAALKPYKITKEVIAYTGNPKVRFLHCLPALHDGSTSFERDFPDSADVSDDVFEADYSRVFNQAENRMHTIKALMIATAGRQG